MPQQPHRLQRETTCEMASLIEIEIVKAEKSNRFESKVIRDGKHISSYYSVPLSDKCVRNIKYDGFLSEKINWAFCQKMRDLGYERIVWAGAVGDPVTKLATCQRTAQGLNHYKIDLLEVVDNGRSN